MDTLEKLNKDYPCDKRKGYGSSGCGSCKKNNDNVNTKKIDCGLYNHSVMHYDCEECSYQERIGKYRILKK
jgi:hypothetical protein